MGDNAPAWVSKPQWATGRLVQGGPYAQDTSTPEWQEKFGPLSGLSDTDRIIAGAGQGMVDVARHAGNLVGLVPDESLAEAQRLDAPLLASGAGRLGSVIGQAAPLAATGLGLEGLLAKYAPMIAASRVLSGAAGGAGQGYVMGDPGNRLSSTLAGVSLGAAFPAAGAASNFAVRGLGATPEAQRFLRAGVPLTPGQMNPGGGINRIEEATAHSVPFLGTFIQNARDAAKAQAQKSLMQEAAAPGSTLAKPAGDINALFDEAYQSYGPLYDKAKGFPVYPKIMQQTGKDVPLSDAFSYSASDKSVRASDSARSQVASWLDNQLSSLKSPVNAADSSGLIDLRSRIRAEIRAAAKSTDKDERASAQLLGNAEDAVTKALESQLPPDAMQALQLADTGYAKLKVIEDAVARAGDREGGFTGHQLSQAVKGATGKQAYARGQGLMRDPVSDYNAIFSQRLPATGAVLPTFGAGAALTGLAAHLGVSPHVAAAALVAAPALMMTKTGRLFAAGMTPPQLLAQRVGQGISNAAGNAANVLQLGPRARMIASQIPTAAVDVAQGAALAKANQMGQQP